MKKIVTIALFLVTIITVSLNADSKKANSFHIVFCNDGTNKEVTNVSLASAAPMCAQHGGLALVT